MSDLSPGYGGRTRKRARLILPAQRGYLRTGGFYGRAGAGCPARELKFHDLDVNDIAVAAGANIVAPSCNLIAQNVTETGRDGRKCTVKNIGWKFQLKLNIFAGTTLDYGDTIRVILYLDKQCNGATAVNTDILETADFQSFNNLANKSRFKTLMDRTYDINMMAAAGDGAVNDSAPVVINDSFYKKCNIPLEFDGATGAITELRSNNIGVMICGEIGVAGFQSKMRLRFCG